MANVVLLVEAPQEGAVAVEFESFEAASDWADKHEHEATRLGSFRIVTPDDALKAADGRVTDG